jgi:catechol 2,3-dioxygenase-like lactoylglutathione lyase family enzyme
MFKIWGREGPAKENALTPKSWQASPVLGVRDVRQAAEYYRDVLGFSLDPVDGVFQPSPGEAGGVYAIVKRGGVWIHFQIRRGELPRRTRQPHERDVYLYVDQLDRVHEDLLTRGAIITQGPRLAAYGIREFDVEDPNGYRLTFGERA